ncbi:hypothetical protein ACLOJK_017151 [Asimina triloba]
MPNLPRGNHGKTHLRNNRVRNNNKKLEHVSVLLLTARGVVSRIRSSGLQLPALETAGMSQWTHCTNGQEQSASSQVWRRPKTAAHLKKESSQRRMFLVFPGFHLPSLSKGYPAFEGLSTEDRLLLREFEIPRPRVSLTTTALHYTAGHRSESKFQTAFGIGFAGDVLRGYQRRLDPDRHADRKSGMMMRFSPGIESRWRSEILESFGDGFTQASMGEGGFDSMALQDFPSGINYIEHRVSKMDTLAGVAIKYGVEVADIKRMNGLVTDRQMFAHKLLQIPLPGRHPPSQACTDGSDSGSSNGQSQTRQPLIGMLDSLQSLKSTFSQRNVSPAMSCLQDYYGLQPEGMEIALHAKDTAHNLEDETLSTQDSELPLKNHSRSRSFACNLTVDNSDLVESLMAGDIEGNLPKKSSEKSVQRSQKADKNQHIPVLVLKDDSANGFTGITGRGLAQRPKSANRDSSATDSDWRQFNPISVGETLLSNAIRGFRKSSSTSNLQDSENNSSIWSTSKWNSKQDWQSTASTTRPIFDGLPKPQAVRRNKAALD